MNMAAAVEGIHSAEALLDHSAARLVGQALNVGSDVVSLSDVAIATIQARIGVAANVSVYHAALRMEKALIDVVG